MNIKARGRKMPWIRQPKKKHPTFVQAGCFKSIINKYSKTAVLTEKENGIISSKY
jgi:hypothetical protein